MTDDRRDTSVLDDAIDQVARELTAGAPHAAAPRARAAGIANARVPPLTVAHRVAWSPPLAAS